MAARWANPALGAARCAAERRQGRRPSRRREQRRPAAAAGEAAETQAAPVVVLPGLGNNAADYEPLVRALRGGDSEGRRVHVCDVKRYDWARNAAGLTDINYWRGTLSPRPTVDWYLRYIDEAVDEALGAAAGDGDGKVVLLAHSAGGWLGRVWMAARQGGTDELNAARVSRFVSLGSPHRPPPADATGIVDQTRGILTFVEDNYPGAHHAGVEYVTVAGTYIRGAELPLPEGASLLDNVPSLVAGFGYKQVCGSGTADGDGITPVQAAHLPGATNVDIEGCYHSPLGAAEGRAWYGDEQFLEQWVHHLG